MDTSSCDLDRWRVRHVVPSASHHPNRYAAAAVNLLPLIPVRKLPGGEEAKLLSASECGLGVDFDSIWRSHNGWTTKQVQPSIK